MFDDRKSEMWSAVGRITKLPPVAPFVVRMRFCVARTRSASRTVARLTPNCTLRAASFGSRCPGVISPLTMSSRSWSATCS